MKYIPNQQEKLYYFLTSIIPLAPAVMYSFSLIDYLVSENPLTSPRFLEVFFKTWVISNPLLTINLGKVFNIKLYKYLLLVFVDISMYIAGYIAYRVHDRGIYIATLAIAALCFMFLMGNIVYYNRRINEQSQTHEMLPVYRTLIKFIILSWAAYPIVFILFKEGIIEIHDVAIAYIILDFLTKTVFSSIIITYHMSVNRKKSIINYQFRLSNAPQILPLENMIEMGGNNGQKDEQKDEEKDEKKNGELSPL
jgi:bacteriorhodopsin